MKISTLLFFCLAAAVFFTGCQEGSFDESMKAVRKLAEKARQDSQKQLDESIRQAEVKAGVRMIDYLISRQYGEIEAKIKSCEDAYTTEPEKEYLLGLYYQSFRKEKAELEPHYTAWVQASPNSHMPYMARGAYYLAMGWFMRGAATADKTAKSQMEELKKYITLAEKDLYKAKELKPGHPHIYALLIQTKMLFAGNTDTIHELAKEGLGLNPYSSWIRSHYLFALLPRWGGTIQDMEQVIRDMKQYADRNKHIKALEGRVLAEQGDGYLFNREFDKALQFYDDALKFGGYWFYFQQQGEALFYNRKKEEAVQWYDKAIALMPSSEQIHRLKLRALK
jgi:tetratricopeptide (TPR) repeat protein